MGTRRRVAKKNKVRQNVVARRAKRKLASKKKKHERLVATDEMKKQFKLMMKFKLIEDLKAKFQQPKEVLKATTDTMDGIQTV